MRPVCRQGRLKVESRKLEESWKLTTYANDSVVREVGRGFTFSRITWERNLINPGIE